MSSPDLNLNKSRVPSGHCRLGRDRGILVILSTAPNVRQQLSSSSLVEFHSSEKSFKQIYVQGLNLKPLVVERGILAKVVEV